MSVYFAESGGYIKIGYSANPIARSTTITLTGTRPTDLAHGTPARLIGWIPGDVWAERAMHVKFLELRVEGEWFRLDEEVVRDVIWSDPRGVDMRRMSALAVFALLRHPELTREDVEAAGIPLMATDLSTVLAKWKVA